VGIGTTSTGNSKFTVAGVAGANNNTLSFSNGTDNQALDILCGRALTNATAGGVSAPLVMTFRSSGSVPGDLAFATGNNERARITAAGDFVHTVNNAAPTLSTNSTMSFELTSNTSLKIVVRGTDGVTRSVSLTLA
jgi:hypothetical protein